MAPPRQINVGPYSFPITAGYSDRADGFSVGPAELEVLDNARAERVRKKAFRVFEKLRGASRRTLSEGQLRLLSEAVAEFDRAVRLERLTNPLDPTASERPGRVAVTLQGDPAEASEFDAELIRLAELRLAAEETARGATLPPEARAAAIALLRDDSAIREAARARVDAALAERERIMAELF